VAEHMLQGETDTYHLLGIILRFLQRNKDGAGSYGLVEALVAPGAGPPLNRHPGDDEGFYILDGRFEFRIGEKSFEVGSGAFVPIPNGEVHTFKNIGSTPARMLILNVPGMDHDRFFSRAGEPMPTGTIEFPAAAPPDIPHLLALGRESGIEFLLPPGH
jgi:mannose-6-phosphate isomerase-like protein (cupin superfamily)